MISLTYKEIYGAQVIGFEGVAGSDSKIRMTELALRLNDGRIISARPFGGQLEFEEGGKELLP